MKGYSYCAINKDAYFIFLNEADTVCSHYPALYRLMNFMTARGWEIEHDGFIEEPNRKDHWVGHKGDLGCAIKRFSSGFEIQFFEDGTIIDFYDDSYMLKSFPTLPFLINSKFSIETKKMTAFIKKTWPDAKNLNVKRKEN